VVSTAQTAEGVSATARMSTAGARTAISLSIGGVTAGQRCRLIAVDQNGRDQVLGEWTVNYTGSAEVRAASDGPPSRLRQLLVRTVDGRQLAALPVPA
jgi:RNA polymerase sigma-70 factor (ECF subfamily)